MRAVLRSQVVDRRWLTAENAPLRQQVAAVRRSSTDPRIRQRYRIFRPRLSRLRSRRHHALVTVRPDTVVNLRTFEILFRSAA